MRQAIELPSPTDFEISAERYRFDGAAEALVAALAFETGTTEQYDYEILYSYGETEGYVVEVWNDQRDRIGNLRPVAA